MQTKPFGNLEGQMETAHTGTAETFAEGAASSGQQAGGKGRCSGVARAAE